MGIFDRFPYSSTHEMNLDFMLGKATEIAEDMQTVTTGMAQVQAGLSAISEKTEQATQAAAAAAQSASSIEGSVTAAEEAAEEAQMHNESAQTWANNALTYKADCQRAATEAAASSSSAAQAATAAAASEDTVATYAQAANASAQSAANNNDSAHQYANQASASASNATFHSSNAQTAATNAQTAATNANTSATNAAASADRAATLKTDVETLHRMCVAAVDQAATDAVNAANSAAQAAATKTDVENLVESLPEDFTDLNNTVNQLSDEIDDIQNDLYYVVTSVNRYDSTLVTSETIDSGKQMSGNGSLIDNNNMDVSPYLEIEPNKTYTMGLVPNYGSALTPWYAASTAICFFDESKNYVGRVDGSNTAVATFTTPSTAKYYRFNIYRSAGLNLNVLNARTMLVYGDALPESFSAYTGDIRAAKLAYPVYYSLKNGILTVTSGYGEGVITVEFGKRGPNNLPDFRFITANGRQKYNNSTDWFGPFVLEALSNIDGDNPTQGAYTGGNHNYADTGSMDSSATARNISLSYYADGKKLFDGDDGFCSIIEIAWKNRVQAYNTKKADGTGREVLEERHTLKFDGAEWETYLEIEALENIFCSQYYGLQCAVTQYPTIYMIGATYRKSFQYTDPHDSGNYNPNIYVGHDTNDRLEMEVDRSVDLGKGSMYGASGTQGFRTSGSKGYTYFITQKNLDANDVYGARGWYRFIPQT